MTRAFGPKLSACIVLYHSGDRALETVRCMQESDCALNLYVVDNSPSDDTGVRIRHQCGGVVYLPQRKNLGYGMANNVVLPYLRSTYHLVCNPDVTFAPELLSRMVAYMDKHRDVAVLTPRVLNPDGTEQHLPRRHPTVRYLLAGRLERFGERFEALRAEYTLADEEITQPTPVEYATGCFMLVRTAYFQQLGGFDKRFKLYHEDSDFSRRVLRKGEIVYHPDMVVTHDWHRDSAHSWKLLLRHVISTIQYFMRWGWIW